MKSYRPNIFSNLNEWIDYIKSIHEKSIDLTLDRVREVAISMEILYPAPFVILVGGTNGKGTTCRLLEKILIASGKRVGLYTSPHLLRYTERIRIHGKELPESEHIKSMVKIDRARGMISLSSFEFTTLSALYLFSKSDLDIVILEVGLGGRMDATNIIQSNISVITNVDIDHSNFLGKTRKNIAFEKAGIFRKNKPAIIGKSNELENLINFAIDSGAIPYSYGGDWYWKIDKHNRFWNWWNRKYEISHLPFPNFPIENASVALATLCCLPFPILENHIRLGIKDLSLPGRFQLIKTNPEIVLDVGHNPHAARYLSNCLSVTPCLGKTRAIIGMLKDKDICKTIQYLKKNVHLWYCSSLNTDRTASLDQIENCLKQEKAKFFSNILCAWNQVITDSDTKDRILVFGSFHTVAPIFKILKNRNLV